ncbi:hypothetical protein NKH18_43840 [Streptomyces sp. M10(2022)]
MSDGRAQMAGLAAKSGESPFPLRTHSDPGRPSWSRSSTPSWTAAPAWQRGG